MFIYTVFMFLMRINSGCASKALPPENVNIVEVQQLSKGLNNFWPVGVYII